MMQEIGASLSADLVLRSLLPDPAAERTQSDSQCGGACMREIVREFARMPGEDRAWQIDWESLRKERGLDSIGAGHSVEHRRWTSREMVLRRREFVGVVRSRRQWYTRNRTNGSHEIASESYEVVHTQPIRTRS